MKNQFSKDSEILNGLIEIPRRDIALLIESGYLLMEFGKLKEAEEVFQGIVAILPESDGAHVAYGNFFFSQGKFDQALKLYQRALEFKPASKYAPVHVGECLYALRRFDEGTVILKQVVSDTEGDEIAIALAKNLLEAFDLGIFGQQTSTDNQTGV